MWCNRSSVAVALLTFSFFPLFFGLFCFLFLPPPPFFFYLLLLLVQNLLFLASSPPFFFAQNLLFFPVFIHTHTQVLRRCLCTMTFAAPVLVELLVDLTADQYPDVSHAAKRALTDYAADLRAIEQSAGSGALTSDTERKGKQQARHTLQGLCTSTMRVWGSDILGVSH